MKTNFLNKDAMLAIGELNDNDEHFHFEDGKYLALHNKIGKHNKGTPLQILFVGHMKHFHQWPNNFSLDLIPLMREAYVNAKALIEKYTQCKYYSLVIHLPLLISLQRVL